MDAAAPVATLPPQSAIKDLGEEKCDKEKSLDEVKPSASPADDSEYDSAASYSDEGEDGRPRSRGSGSEGSVGLERESGDGQESVSAKKVDDDEDKKNPQYIPKRGTFYEHDDRTAEDIENEEVAEPEKDKDPKKKIWQDKKEKWSHDRFNDCEQAPKSRSELVAIYGYDIRNEDGPPRARRRRRYGRGPNKYTRNWEDEAAYNKPVPVRAKKPPRRHTKGEEYPSLGGGRGPRDDREGGRQDEGDDLEDNRAISESTEPEQSETNGNVKTASNEPVRAAPPPQDNTQYNKYQNQSRVGTGRVVKPKKEIKDSDYRGFTTKTRQVRNVKTEQKIIPKPIQKRNDDFIQSQNFTNKNNNIHEVDKELGKLSLQETVYKGKHGGQRQGSVPPRLQNEQQKGSKRYSSIRQRSLPEAATPPFNQHSNYYPNEYNQQGQVSQPGLIHQNAQLHPSNPQVPQIPPPPLAPIPQVPVTATPILGAAPQFAPPFTQPAPPFLQAGVAPPPFIAQQTPQIINYVPSQPQFPQGYQGYQQPFNPVSQPTELYQPQPGITYYSTDQQVPQRIAPQKRPKAAIPIVAPPSIESKGKISKDDDTSSTPDPEINEQMEERCSQQESVQQ